MEGAVGGWRNERERKRTEEDQRRRDERGKKTREVREREGTGLDPTCVSSERRLILLHEPRAHLMLALNPFLFGLAAAAAAAATFDAEPAFVSSSRDLHRCSVEYEPHSPSSLHNASTDFLIFFFLKW